MSRKIIKGDEMARLSEKAEFVRLIETPYWGICLNCHSVSFMVCNNCGSDEVAQMIGIYDGEVYFLDGSEVVK